MNALPIAAGLAAVMFSAVASSQSAQAASDTPRVKPLIDVRARWENVDQDGFAEQADAVTLRARIGAQTRPILDTSLLVEGELVRGAGDHYNDGVNGRTEFPTIADAETEEINRLQLSNTSIAGTTITVGRQRINLDDQRFVGNAAWRQNEQTFDSLRIVNQSIAHLTFDLAYVDQVNRVFGKESAVGRFEGGSVLANVGYQFAAGKLTAFGYRLDFDVLEHAPAAQRNAAVNDSSETWGLRFAGDRTVHGFKLAYTGSFATQRDEGNNPLDYSADYYLVEAGVTRKGISAAAGVEILEGTGTKGFSTPLASLHRFQGWADKFLTTPVNGIEDRYVSLGAEIKPAGVLGSVSALAVYHSYEAQHGSLLYGSEVDLQLQAKWQKFTGLLKYADYRADDLLTDTRKLWVQIEYVW